jgi:flavin reductase (DIM6/NTAB) family NADH-FMN oxidoreductase RutF/rubredoxin
MINYEALLKVSYGLYVVCSGTKQKGNGYISNTVFQVTSDPPRFAASCNKENFTAGLIRETGLFSVSVLQADTAMETISHFGYKSGKDADKLKGMEIRFRETGVPVVLNDAIAYLEFRVTDTMDVGTHLLFIGDLVHAEVLDGDKDPLTYLHYTREKKGKAPKNAPTYIDPSKLKKDSAGKKASRYQCPNCGYIYDEEKEGVKFSDLPDDWVCPVCGEKKSEFMKI